MKLNALGRTGLQVSALSLGAMNFGWDWHGIGAIDERAARNLVAVALDRGVNLIDTADIYGYGASESMLGRVLARRRSRVLIATKVLGEMRPGDRFSGGLSRRHIEEALDDSLRRLRTGYVDLYMPHGWDPGAPLDETLEAMHRAKTAGKIRVLGCSNFSGEQLRQSLTACMKNRWHRLEFDQVQYSLACRDVERDLLPVCSAFGASVLAWSPLGGGLLSGKYAREKRPAGRRQDPQNAFPPLPEQRLGGLLRVLERVARLEDVGQAQAALGWLLSKPAVASVVVGARTVAQLKMNLAAKPLSERAHSYLQAASDLTLFGTGATPGTP